MLHVNERKKNDMRKICVQRNVGDVSGKHGDLALLTRVPEKHLKLPLIIPRTRHIPEDPDHVQVKVLELLSSTLFTVAGLTLVNIIHVDRRTRNACSFRLREAASLMLRVLSSWSSSSMVK
ncbi:uncharacterized protein LOC119768808 [Culex quinquefasciatus]|uniref:uncharacterized protein LOC119765471 n=1 Tax=Culex quinquefasciatus TaxID=7176 RepID=UPI0018E3387E|nr:uncharacterized protein LOC119765471 [Culex quinquefasciatus]XP_038116015.1 uncharacterized protein LOC119768808 [Culex quinquefasciatus]